MARLIKFGHNIVVTGGDDATKQVSENAWNDGHNELGMFGWGTVTTLTVASDIIIPVNSMHKLDGQGASADDLATITNTETAEFDELWLFSGAQTITLINSGNIVTLSGGDTVISTTVPTKLIRVGTNWYEVGVLGVSVFSDTAFAIQDDGDPTKQMLVSLGGADANFDTTLTFIQTSDIAITFPDATTTLMGKDTTDVMTEKSYDLGGSGNILTGSTAEFNTALQSDSFFFISQNISNMATSDKSEFDGALSDGTFAFLNQANTFTLSNTFANIVHTGRHQYDKGADVGSADAPTLGGDGNVFDITGTTTMNHIQNTGWQIGSVITLHFVDIVTLNHATGSETGDEASLYLNGDTNFTTSAGDILTFVLLESIQWQETSRNSGAGGGEVPVWTQDHDADGFDLILDTDGNTKIINDRDAGVADNEFGFEFENVNRVLWSTTQVDFDMDASGTGLSLINITDVVLDGRLKTSKGTDEVSATELTLATDGNVFDISASNTINTISPTGWQAGSIITLQFDGAPQVTHNSGGTNDILLGNQSNFATSAGDVLQLFFNGTDWVEISRSVVGGGGGDNLGNHTATEIVKLVGEGILFDTAGITMDEVSDVLEVTVTDDTINAGFKIQNTDGFIEFINGTATVGGFAPIIKGQPNGSGIAMFLMAQIPVADDTGSEPAFKIDARRVGGASITARGLVAFTNFDADMWTMDAGGNVDQQGNNLLNVGQYTIPDDTINAGWNIVNSDGSISIKNITGDANSFSPAIDMNSRGATKRCFILANIPVADDSGTVPVFALDCRQDDDTAVVTRPLINFSNLNDLKWEMDASGNVNMQENDLSGVKDITLSGRQKLDKGIDVASQGSGIITLGADGNVFDITGTNTTDEILATNWQTGSIVTLNFVGVLQLTNNSGGTNDLLMTDATNYTTSAGDVFQFYFNGTDWIEISRSLTGTSGSEVFNWTNDHDTNGFALIFTDDATSPAGTVPFINWDTSVMQFNVPDGDTFSIRINDVPQGNWDINGLDLVTGKTYEINGVNQSSIGLHDIYLDAGGFVAVDSGALTTRINGSGANQKAFAYIPFTNGSVTFAVAKFVLPRTYNLGTLTAIVHWTSQTEGAGTVEWDVSAVAISDATDIEATAYGTLQTATDTQTTVNEQQISPRTSAITIGNTPIDADMIYLKVQRDGTTDTFDQEAQLLGVWLDLTTDRGTS